MPRRSYRRARTFAQPSSTTRLTSMLMMLFVLGLMYTRARDPSTWRWLVPDSAAMAALPAAKSARAESPPEPDKPEEVVAGPTDQDPDERAEVQRLFEAISDKASLDRTEMPAYWRLMKWARAQTFDELKARARSDVTYAQLWEQPGRFRGKLITLKLHVRRAVDNDELAQNPLGLERVFELWGATDESKSYPYAVVVSDLPADLNTGGDVYYDVLFTGYFLKLIAYDAHDKKRAAPLLLGRLQSIESPAARQQTAAGGDAWLWTGAGAIALVFGAWLWMTISKRGKPALERTSISEASVESWLAKSPPEDEPQTSPESPA